MRAFAALLTVLLLPSPTWAQAANPPAPAHPAARPAPAAAPHPPPPAHRAPPAAAAAHSKVPPRHGPPPPPASAPPTPAPAPPPPAEPQKGSSTGLPLPRYAALRSEEVNFRSGPGPRYPIEWVYKRRDLPVEIVREFDNFRLVQDSDGVKGWVNQATLTARRTAIVVGGEHVLHQSADDKAGPVARLKPGVIIRLRSCDAGSDWCEAQAGDYRGWIRRTQIWGTMSGEAIQ